MPTALDPQTGLTYELEPNEAWALTRERRAHRNAAIFEACAHLSVEQVAGMYGLSKRQVWRIRQSSNPDLQRPPPLSLYV